MMIYPLLVFTIITNAVAQLILKEGAKNTNVPSKIGYEWLMAMINPYVVLGIVLYGFSFMVYFRLLNELDLSFVSPVIMATSFVLVYIFSACLLAETISFYRLFGLILIIIGVTIVFLGR